MIAGNHDAAAIFDGGQIQFRGVRKLRMDFAVHAKAGYAAIGINLEAKMGRAAGCVE